MAVLHKVTSAHASLNSLVALKHCWVMPFLVDPDGRPSGIGTASYLSNFICCVFFRQIGLHLVKLPH